MITKWLIRKYGVDTNEEKWGAIGLMDYWSE